MISDVRTYHTLLRLQYTAHKLFYRLIKLHCILNSFSLFELYNPYSATRSQDRIIPFKISNSIKLFVSSNVNFIF